MYDMRGSVLLILRVRHAAVGRRQWGVRDGTLGIASER